MLNYDKETLLKKQFAELLFSNDAKTKSKQPLHAQQKYVLLFTSHKISRTIALLSNCKSWGSHEKKLWGGGGVVQVSIFTLKPKKK